MRIFRGQGVCGGIAVGTAKIYARDAGQATTVDTDAKSAPFLDTRKTTTDAETELSRFSFARETAKAELAALYDTAVLHIGAEHAAIFRAHQMLLDDTEFVSLVSDMVRSRGVAAEDAVLAAGERLAGKMLASEDETLRTRAADIRDVAERVVRVLCGDKSEELGDKAHNGQEGALTEWQSEIADCETGIAANGEPAILFADDLLPSEVLQLDKTHVAAVVMRSGTPYSHASILLRAMDIPTVCNTATDGFSEVEENSDSLVIVDGDAGTVIISPDETTVHTYEAKQKENKAASDTTNAATAESVTTQDGKTITLSANINRLSEISDAIKTGTDGIGLFRSEFLFLDADDYPTEDEQFEIYKSAVTQMQGKRVVIRTLDIGADKTPAYFHFSDEERNNPENRGIRLCLNRGNRPDFFRTQLRALLRASAYGNLAILYPMVTTLEEVQAAKKIVSECKNELAAEQIPYGNPQQGVMIETPEAVRLSDALANEADFFSIGTNDLMRHFLTHGQTAEQTAQSTNEPEPLPQDILQAIKTTVENAHKANIPVSVCGELATDTAYTETLLKLGVDELSVTPSRVPAVRDMFQTRPVRAK